MRRLVATSDHMAGIRDRRPDIVLIDIARAARDRYGEMAPA